MPGADPAEWYGVEPASSAGALRGDEAVVRVSPSRLHAIEECPLNWAIGELGGEDASAGAGLGTILHAALETTAGSDEEALWLARDVAKKVESELTYPGQIKVTVIRETRAVEYAR